MSVVKSSDAELRRALTPLHYQVTQRESTEPPFHNEYWDSHRPQIYWTSSPGSRSHEGRDGAEDPAQG